MNYDVTIAGETRSIQVERASDGGYRVSVDGAPARSVTAKAVGPAEWRVQGRTLGLAVSGDRVDVQLQGHALVARVVDPRRDAFSNSAGVSDGSVVTQMPGSVVRVLVQPGEEVAAGDVVVVVEAMKMENEFKSAVTGTVKEVLVAAGDTVETGMVLLTIQPL